MSLVLWFGYDMGKGGLGGEGGWGDCYIVVGRFIVIRVVDGMFC